MVMLSKLCGKSERQYSVGCQRLINSIAIEINANVLIPNSIILSGYFIAREEHNTSGSKKLNNRCEVKFGVYTGGPCPWGHGVIIIFYPR